ncbi:hypothetical protein POVCU2_0095320, partial [Plasmodium ovale curtisi]
MGDITLPEVTIKSSKCAYCTILDSIAAIRIQRPRREKGDDPSCIKQMGKYY